MKSQPENVIPLTECKDRKYYKINSRNLSFGVFNEKVKGFVGLRTKFGNIYAFTEYHWDTGEPHGTANPLEELPEELPNNISMDENGPTICRRCKVLVKFLGVDAVTRWVHLHEAHTNSQEVCDEIEPVCTANEELEHWLTQMKLKYNK